MTPAEGLAPWYAINTKPRKEDLVRVQLEHAGLTVFLPRVLEWSVSRRRTEEKVNLLFPGYLFARLSIARDFPRVRWTPGVKRVVGPADQPTPIDDALIEEISARMGTRGYVVQRPRLQAGDAVEVRRGPFAGLLGVVDAPSTATERVRVLLTLFSRRTTVEVDGRDLLRIGHSF